MMLDTVEFTCVYSLSFGKLLPNNTNGSEFIPLAALLLGDTVLSASVK